MSKLKVSIVDEHTLKLEEDGKLGDTIDLKALHTVDESFILERIRVGQDETYKRLLDVVKKENLSDTQLKLSEQLQAFEQTKYQLNQEKQALENKLNTQLQLSKKNEENMTSKLKLEFDLERQKLNHDIKNIEIQTKLSLESQYKEQLNEKNNLLQRLNSEKEQLVLKHQLEIKNQVSKLQEEIQKRETDLDVLRRDRATRNIKNIGEDLENWCNEQFKSVSLYGFKTSIWEKDNVVVRAEGATKGTKGDYIFKVYNNNHHDILLTSAMCEMKSEALESENKKKNSDHYKKLDDDRIKKGLEYAILISELEYNTESDAPIFIVPDYPKMYVVRPHFFMTLLGIIESIGMKYASIITEKELDRIEFKASEDIIEEFEKFKDEILNNSMRHISTQLNQIKTRTDTIITSANAILESVRVVVDTHLMTVKNKIDGFQIKKVLNHIEKIN